MGVCSCLNLLNPALKMGIFILCMLYFNKADFLKNMYNLSNLLLIDIEFFQCLATSNNAAMSILVCVLLYTHVLISRGYVYVGIAGSWVCIWLHLADAAKQFSEGTIPIYTLSNSV